MEVLSNLIVVIISQHRCVPNGHVVYIKLKYVICKLYLSELGGGNQDQILKRTHPLYSAKYVACH